MQKVFNGVETLYSEKTIKISSFPESLISIETDDAKSAIKNKSNIVNNLV